MLNDTFYAVLSACTTGFTQAHRAQRNVQIVGYNEDMPYLDLVEIDQRAHRFATQVHIGLWFSEDNFLAAHHAAGRLCLAFGLAEGQRIAPRQFIRDAEAIES